MKCFLISFVLLRISIVKTNYSTTANSNRESYVSSSTTEEFASTTPLVSISSIYYSEVLAATTSPLSTEKIQNLTGNYNWKTKLLNISWNNDKSSLSFYLLKISYSRGKNCSYVINKSSVKNESLIQNEEEIVKDCSKYTNSGIYLNLIEVTNNLKVDIIKVYENGTRRHFNGQLVINMTKPLPVKDISLIESGENFLKLKWLDVNINEFNTIVDKYLVFTNPISIPENVYTAEINKSSLKECTKYCFTIIATNEANFSSTNSSECFTTKARILSDVRLFNISSGYSQKRNITWEYLKVDKCVSFNIKYRIHNIPNSEKLNKTNELFYQITDLDFNKFYNVSVTPVTVYETADGRKNGNESNFSTFFTGHKIIKITNITDVMDWNTQNLSLQWNIEKQFDGNILYYSIYIRNSSNKCLLKSIYKIQQDHKMSTSIEDCHLNSTSVIKFGETVNLRIKIPNNISSFFLEIYGTNQFGNRNLIKRLIEMKKPNLLLNLTLKEKGVNYLILKLNQSEVKESNSPVFGYRIKYSNETKEIRNIMEIRIENLTECSEYCFTIEAFNSAGSSNSSKHQCYTTKTRKLEKIELRQVPTKYSTFREITWNYSGNEKCLAYYLLYYENDSQLKKMKNITNVEKSYNLTNLELNKQYSIQIKSCTLFDTENGDQCGQFSEKVQFYTISETNNISNLKYSMDWSERKLSISWTIDKNFKDSLFSYIIKFFNSAKICILAQIYQFKSNFKKSLSDSCNVTEVKNKSFSVENEFNEKIKCCENEINIDIKLFGLNIHSLKQLMNDSINLRMERPGVIQNITLGGNGLRTLKLKWFQSELENKNKPVKKYQIQWNQKVKTETMTTTEIDNLNQCTKYCFTITAINDAGNTSSNHEKCFTTQAPNLLNTTLKNIPSGYRSLYLITWEYHGPRNCSVDFDLEYWNKYNKNNHIYINTNKKSLKTNKTNYTINELKRNQLYYFQVRSVTNFDTPNGKKEGPVSNIVSFYNGVEKIIVDNFQVKYDYYKKRFHFSWSINRTLEQEIQGYVIIIGNSTKSCLSALEFKGKAIDKAEEYTKEKETLFKTRNCKSNSLGFYLNESDDFKFDHELNLKMEIYNITVYIFNKLGFQMVQNETCKINVPRNPAQALIWIFILILLMGSLVIAFVFYREQMKIYLPFLNEIPFCNDKSKFTEIKNQNSNETNEEKVNIVLDERFFDCTTLVEFLDKIDGYESSLTDFPAYVDLMKENKDVKLIQEYAKINNLTVTLEHQLHLTKFIGKSPFNLKKNRFRNILPFDQNLVYLKSKSSPENYLNANYVPFSTDVNKIEYIASQGPIEATVFDFILMIWEQNITCIVMLTRTYEDEKFKCLQYWPDNLGETCRFKQHYEFILEKLYEKEELSYFERKFLLKNSKTHEERFIYQIHMHMWMDFSAPDLMHFYSVLVRFQDMRETIVNPPFLVHCSAGVGRTGTFICLDRIVRMLNKGHQRVNVFKVVMELRASRNCMVQRYSQYIFIHEFLKFYIQKYLTDENLQMISTV